jgi:hypothetical protein
MNFSIIVGRPYKENLRQPPQLLIKPLYTEKSIWTPKTDIYSLKGLGSIKTKKKVHRNNGKS